MAFEQKTIENNLLNTLHSPEGVPCQFVIEINETESGNKVTFRVQGADPSSTKSKTLVYQLKGKEHNDYLLFFEQLAKDFGLQLPYNRQPVVHRNFNAVYREVLCENISPGILYGYGDPAMIRVNKGSESNLYYLVVTSNDAPDSFPLLRSSNLKDWEHAGYIFPHGSKPSWALDGPGISDYWAPEMHQVGNEFRVYYVARDKQTNDLCIGVAKSLIPEGPYQPDSVPLLTGNVIDPHLFVEDKATTYLFWKEDNNEVWPGRLINFFYYHSHLVSALFSTPKEQLTVSFILTLWPWARSLQPMERFFVLQLFIEVISDQFAAFRQQLRNIAERGTTTQKQEIDAILHQMKTRVFAQLLSGDGSCLVGQKSLIIENDLDWEAHLVEGMWVHQQGAKYYLFYAGNDFSTDKYGIGVAIANSPLGPYKKMPEPLLYSTTNWRAPGHPSVVLNVEGKPELFLHAYYPGKAGYKQFRALLSLPIKLEEDRVTL